MKNSALGQQAGLANGRAWALSRTLLCLPVLLLLWGCGSSSGAWDDDPDNWWRAFQSIKPDDVVVLHSKYWRSSHWTYEFEYFFEIEANAALQEQLFTQNSLIQLNKADALAALNDLHSEPPEWFAPKAIEVYEVWAYDDRSDSHFLVFVDLETGTLYLTDYLV